MKYFCSFFLLFVVISCIDTIIIKIDKPQDDVKIMADSIQIEGSVSPNNAILTLGLYDIIKTQDGKFKCTIRLKDDINIVTIWAETKRSSEKKELRIYRLHNTKKEKLLINAEKIRKTRENIDSCVFELEDFNGADYRGSVASLIEEVNYFSYVITLIEAAEKDSIEKIKEKGKTIEKKLIKIQLAEFPKIRKEYARIMNKKLWVEDIEVRILGNRNSTLQFVSGTFASHSNISDFHFKMARMVQFFRFKRTNFLWYEYDDEYPYYRESSVSDDVLYADYIAPNSDNQ